MSKRVGKLGFFIHTRKLVESNLDLKGLVAVLVPQLQIFLCDEWDLLIRGFCAQDVACVPVRHLRPK